MRDFVDDARILWKRALSIGKRDWKLSDYPIRVRVQKKDVPDESRYWARILGWNIDGLGRTRADALAELSRLFEKRRAALLSEGKPVPRPGTEVSVQFASQERVNAHSELAEDFIHRVLQLDRAWISDESSLWDFPTEKTNSALQARVREVYGVDVSGIESGNLADIFDCIAGRRAGHSVGVW